jgi:hypothetical protein
MTVAGKSERSHTPNSGSENGDAVKTKVGIDDVSLEGFNIQHQICGWGEFSKKSFLLFKKKMPKVQTTKILICVMKILSRAINFDRQGQSLTVESALT